MGKSNRIVMLLFLILLLGCDSNPPSTSCVSIYDIWAKKFIMFKIVRSNNKEVVVRRIREGEEMSELETFTSEDFFIWQPIDCRNVLK